MAASLDRFLDGMPVDGLCSVWIGALDGEPWLSVAADASHYAASTMKIWVVLAAYRSADAGTLDLDSTVKIKNSFVSAASEERFTIDSADDGDPEPWRREGSAVALRWLAHRAIVRSSNLATNLVLEAVGLPAVAEAVQASGAVDSVVARGIEDVAARDAGLQNMVTARDLAQTLQSLADDTAASPSSCREILDVLAAQQFNDGIPAGLPAGTRVAHKTGEVDGVSHDAGIVYPSDADPFLVVVCTTADSPEADRLRVISSAATAAWHDRRVMA